MNYRLGLILFTLLLAVNLGKENNSPYVKRGLAAVDRSACIELVNGIMSLFVIFTMQKCFHISYN